MILKDSEIQSDKEVYVCLSPMQSDPYDVDDKIMCLSAVKP
jgi:hypothetical protein